MSIDSTHDAALTSWVDSANLPETDFPIQNLPLGVFRRRGSEEAFRPGVAIGNRVLDLAAAAAAGALPAEVAEALHGSELNAFMAHGRALRRALRRALSEGLRSGSPAEPLLAPALLSQAEIELAVPCRIGDYTDFYTGIHHATTGGQAVSPDKPAPAELQMGADRLPRPEFVDRRQRPALHAPARPVEVRWPRRRSSGLRKRMDYELELGVFVSRGNPARQPHRDRTCRRSRDGPGVAQRLGRRATCRPGNTSRSGRSSRRASPPRSRRGSSRSTRSNHSAHRGPAPADDPQPLPYLDSAANRDAARSISHSKSGSGPMRCAAPARRPCVSRNRTSGMPTGPSRNSSSIKRRRLQSAERRPVRLGARNPDRRQTRADRCSN